ncbi:MAG: energy-coupled thiamine transporter ThiT [Faecalibacterium sp.]|nr:energy-coupled thiamine transporter ThiT [Faecalibacterium sp.]
MSKSLSTTRTLVEGALMIALSTVLSLIQIPLMPHGGSITLLSMLPIILMSFRHGTRWGLLTAFANSIIQFVQGIGNLAYCQTLTAQIGCVLLDYLLAFTLLGLAAALAKPAANKTVGAGLGTAGVCLLRFVCSFLSGYIVWKDYDYAFEWLNNFRWGAWFTTNLGENALCWFYSLAYNATYMLPETVLTVVGVVVLYKTAPRLFSKQ